MDELANNAKPRRAVLLDEIRGADIILMVLYHLGYDLVYLFGVEVPGYRNFAMPYIQPLIAGTFIILSGIACRYSRSNVKRGIKTFALGMLLTLVTYFFMRGEAIYFGILHFMGTAMILFAALRPVLNKISPSWGIPLFIGLFVFTGNLSKGYLGLPGVFTLTLPQELYKIPMLLPLGFYGMGSDYFPLIPYLFLYIAGSYIGVMVIRGVFPEWIYNMHSPFLASIGRRTIIIYMMHQPVIMAVLWVVFKILER